MSDCLGKWLSAYVDGEIDGRRRDRLVAHLARCERCRESVMAERAAKQRLARTSPPVISPDLWDRLLDVDVSLAGSAIVAPAANLRRRTMVLAGLATAGTAAAVGVVVTAPHEGGAGPVVTPPLTQFTQVHFGSTIGLPVGGPGLAVQPAAYGTLTP